jgi:hypothetical protein
LMFNVGVMMMSNAGEIYGSSTIVDDVQRWWRDGVQCWWDL